MLLPDVFDPAVTEALVARLEKLTPSSTPQWGRMDVAQMLAHCCLPYRQLAGEIGGGPWLLRFLAKHVFKQKVVGEVPYGPNIPSPKPFRVTDPRVFEPERDRLVACIRDWHGKGADAYEGRLHASFGVLTAREWSNLLYKHLDHHLRQFGA